MNSTIMYTTAQRVFTYEQKKEYGRFWGGYKKRIQALNA